MGEVLVRVRDFAQRCGCTPQNIYGHLKTYAADLKGHTFQGKGRQGVLLDEFAQDFLKSVMYPKDLSENTLQIQINELRGQLMQAETEKLRLGSLLVQMEAERDRALIDNKQYQKLLKASEEAEEAKDKELDQVKADKAAAVEEAQNARKEVDQLHLDLEQEKALRAAAEAENQALKGRRLWERIIRKGEK